MRRRLRRRERGGSVEKSHHRRHGGLRRERAPRRLLFRLRLGRRCWYHDANPWAVYEADTPALKARREQNPDERLGVATLFVPRDAEAAARASELAYEAAKFDWLRGRGLARHPHRSRRSAARPRRRDGRTSPTSSSRRLLMFLRGTLAPWNELYIYTEELCQDCGIGKRSSTSRPARRRRSSTRAWSSPRP